MAQWLNTRMAVPECNFSSHHLKHTITSNSCSDNPMSLAFREHYTHMHTPTSNTLIHIHKIKIIK